LSAKKIANALNENPGGPIRGSGRITGNPEITIQ
jgi:hypothetical protein